MVLHVCTCGDAQMQRALCNCSIIHLLCCPCLPALIPVLCQVTLACYDYHCNDVFCSLLKHCHNQRQLDLCSVSYTRLPINVAMGMPPILRRY